MCASCSRANGPVPEFLLRTDGDRTWFRRSDEPFVEDGTAE